MEIIKRDETEYQAVCGRCGTVFRFKKTECGYTSDYNDNAKMFIQCPQCGQYVFSENYCKVVDGEVQIPKRIEEVKEVLKEKDKKEKHESFLIFSLIVSVASFIFWIVWIVLSLVD